MDQHRLIYGNRYRLMSRKEKRQALERAKEDAALAKRLITRKLPAFLAAPLVDGKHQLRLDDIYFDTARGLQLLGFTTWYVDAWPMKWTLQWPPEVHAKISGLAVPA
jgi:hypothetical protein